MPFYYLLFPQGRSLRCRRIYSLYIFQRKRFSGRSCPRAIRAFSREEQWYFIKNVRQRVNRKNIAPKSDNIVGLQCSCLLLCFFPFFFFSVYLYTLFRGYLRRLIKTLGRRREKKKKGIKRISSNSRNNMRTRYETVSPHRYYP